MKGLQDTRNTSDLLLGLSRGIVYDKRVTHRLDHVLMEATMIAQENKEANIKEGLNTLVDIKMAKRREGKETFVIYHVPFEDNDNRKITSFDIPTIDTSNIDFRSVVLQCIESIQKANADAEIILCTTADFASCFSGKNISILIPKVRSNQPMYYRALTYNTLIQKDLVAGKVCFLDSDTILINNISKIWEKLSIRIAVTARFAPNLMPINEGVIFADNDHKCTKEFFAEYIGTYKSILKSEKIQMIMNNIDLKRWRGGQLSLNAICGGGNMISRQDSTKNLKILPSNKFNRSIKTVEERDALMNSNDCFIGHFKGRHKKALAGR